MHTVENSLFFQFVCLELSTLNSTEQSPFLLSHYIVMKQKEKVLQKEYTEFNSYDLFTLQRNA